MPCRSKQKNAELANRARAVKLSRASEVDAHLSKVEPGAIKPGERLILKAEMTKKVGLTYTTIWRLMREGTFPLSVTHFGGKVAWVESEIDQWIAARSQLRSKFSKGAQA